MRRRTLFSSGPKWKYAEGMLNLTNNGSSATTINIHPYGAAVTAYSINSTVDWEECITGSDNAISIPVNGVIYLQGLNTSLSSSNYVNISSTDNTGNLSASGNPLSMVWAHDFSSNSFRSYSCYKLFDHLVNLVNINEIELKGKYTYTSNYSIDYMFSYCSSLVTIPGGLFSNLTTINSADCMFSHCTSLTTIPSDLFQTITYLDAEYMFAYCTSLATIPNGLLNRPSQNVNEVPFLRSMFRACTSLTTIPSDLFPSTAPVKLYSYTDMFNGCTSLTNVCNLPSTTFSGNYGYQRMFKNCTSLTSIPVDLLPATTLTAGCYDEMFSGCTGLTTIPYLPGTNGEAYCYRKMFNQCSSLVNFPNNFTFSIGPINGAEYIGNECCAYMFYGCTSLTTLPSNCTLPATTLSYGCYKCMFSECTSLTTVPSGLLPATTLAQACYYNMFYGCTSLTTAPDLPANSPAFNCYAYMFDGCSKLNYIKMMLTDITDALDTWVRGVASSGTFVKKTGASWSVRGVSGIPYNWTIQTASS